MIHQYSFGVGFTFKPRSTRTLNEQLCNTFAPDVPRKIKLGSSSYPGCQIAYKMFFSKAFAQLRVVFAFVYFITKGREGLVTSFSYQNVSKKEFM